MKLLARKTVLEYKYETEEEAERHEITMKIQGWIVSERKSLFAKHYRSYFQRMREGMFL